YPRNEVESGAGGAKKGQSRMKIPAVLQQEEWPGRMEDLAPPGRHCRHAVLVIPASGQINMRKINPGKPSYLISSHVTLPDQAARSTPASIAATVLDGTK